VHFWPYSRYAHDRTLSTLGIRAAKNKALSTRGGCPQKLLNERRCSTLFLIFSGLSSSRSESALQNQNEGRCADQVQCTSEVIPDERMVRYVWNFTYRPSLDVTLPSGASTSREIHTPLASPDREYQAAGESTPTVLYLPISTSHFSRPSGTKRRRSR
jgi:hypothetical protein